MLIIPTEEGKRLFGPRLLPDGDSLLFSMGPEGRFDDDQIVVQSLSTGERKVLVSGGSDARYLPTGHLVYALGDGLLAVRFDLETLSVAGGAVPLVQGVRRANGTQTGAANYGVSNDGTLVYIAGSGGTFTTKLLWMDREGGEEIIELEDGDYSVPKISPDNNRLVFESEDSVGNSDIWTYNVALGIPTRLTFEPGFNERPHWTPDGQRIVYSLSQDGGGLFSRAADGTGQLERLTTSEGSEEHIPAAVAADGSEVIYLTDGPGVNGDIYAVSLDGEHTSRLILGSPFDVTEADLSPNGRWIAYVTDESGDDEVYVRPYPNVDEGRWQVSRGGGTNVRWGPDGRELFYRSGFTMWVVGVDDETSFSHGLPEALFIWSMGGPRFDVSPSGDRFVVVAGGTSSGESSVFAIVQNWFEDLKRLAPQPE